MTSIKAFATITLGLSIGLIPILSPREVHAHHGHAPSPCCTVRYYPTQYRQGPLLVEVTGLHFGTIEAYYKDLAYREEIPGASNLHVNRVHLSPGDDGLFVTSYGANNENFFAIGWTNNGVGYRKITADSKVEGSSLRTELPGPGPIFVSWRSEKVVRLATHFGGVEHTCILRWNSNSSTGSWERLNQQTNSWKPVTQTP